MDPSPGMYKYCRALGKAVPKHVYLVRSYKEPPWWGGGCLGTPLQQPDIFWSSPIKDRTYTITQDCTTSFRKQSDIARRNSVFLDNPAEKRFLTIKLKKWSYLAKDSLSLQSR